MCVQWACLMLPWQDDNVLLSVVPHAMTSSEIEQLGRRTDVISETWLGVGHRIAAEDAVPRALEAADDPSESHADAAATSHFLTDLFGALANGDGAAARHRNRPQVPVDPQVVAYQYS